MLKKLYDWLFHPEVRLECRLPWGAKKLGKTYAVAFMYYFVGSMIPLALLVITLWVGVRHAPHLVLSIIGPEGTSCMPLILGVTAASFVIGFGMELWYINSQMRRDGLSLPDVVGLNLKSLNNQPALAIKYSLVALLIGLIAQSLLSFLLIHEPSQSVAGMAKGLHGLPMFGFICLAVIAAPVVEEIVFRGYAFNALRMIFRNDRLCSGMLAGNARFADWMAVSVSSVIFAAAHLEPSAFIHLFILGVILAELYRRSGTLICPMLLHALNNAIAISIIVLW